MKIFDVINKYHNQYSIDHWMQKYKCWWALFWWSHGVIVVNVYVIYNTECELKSMRPMSYYEFQRKLVLIKLDPQLFGVRDHLASAEQWRGVFNHKSSTSSVCQNNKRRYIQEGQN